MTTRAVLFDWGGTLVRDDSLNLGAPAAAVSRFLGELPGPSVTAEQFERAFEAVLPAYSPGVTLTSPSLEQLLPLALERLGCSPTLAALERCAQLFFECCTTGQSLFDDARALLASLRYRGYGTAIVTNTIFPARLLRDQLRQLGVAGYIDAIVTSADEGFDKPHPAPFLRALDALGVKPHDALFVGDTPATDIAGARAAGIPAVVLARRGPPPGAGTVVSRLSALNALLGEGPAE